MSDHETLVDDDGRPYPETVQILARHYFPDLDVPEAQEKRQALAEALAAVRAVAISETAHAARLDDDTRDGRIIQVFLSGYAAGTAGELIRAGAPAGYAQPYGAHIAQHIADDPIARAQLLEGLVPLFQTGEVPPDAPAYIQVHNGHERPQEPT